MAMKLTTGILAMGMMVCGAWAQNPDAIDNARSTAKSLQQKQANDSSAAPAKAKPVPGAPAPAVKPAAIPTSEPIAAHTSAQHNQLQHVNVVPGAEGVQIEISSTQSVTPRLSKLKSPDRVLVELPETVIASSQSKISVDRDGVKGVRIGMDGKTPPTTSVVIDLEKPLAYELTPGPAGKVILTLHSEGAPLSIAKNTANSSAPNSAPSTAKISAPLVKSATAAAKPAVVATAKPVSPAAAKPVVVASAKPAVIAATKPVTTATAKPALVPLASSSAAAPKLVLANSPVSKSVVPASKPEPIQQAKAAPSAKIAAPAAKIAAASAPKLDAPSAAFPSKVEAAPKTPKEEKKWAMNGKRDPFFSPVVQQNGSGCSTGKKCLDIGAINLRGVVKSDTGFIAVVTNSLNKAYFLRENDPVFNGYVVKITGDSVVFQETIQDKLGKSFTREVVKRIFTPAV
jgi:hypothetical protein